MYAYSLEMTLSTDYELIIENYRFCLNSSKLEVRLKNEKGKQPRERKSFQVFLASPHVAT